MAINTLYSATVKYRFFSIYFANLVINNFHVRKTYKELVKQNGMSHSVGELKQ